MNASRLLTIDEAARYLRVSKASLRRWTKSGKLRCARVGLRGERRFAVAELELFLQRCSAATSDRNGKRFAIAPNAALDAAAAHGTVRHVCSHFTDTAECWRLFQPYFSAHAAAGAPVFYIYDSTSPEQFFTNVTAAGFDSQTLIDRGLLELVHSSGAYLQTGSFSPASMLAYVASVIDRARLHGHRRALVSGEMTWSLSGCAGADGMIDYENRLNDLLQQSPDVTIVCHYSTERFGAQLTLEALRVHPFVQLSTGLYRGLHSGLTAAAAEPRARP